IWQVGRSPGSVMLDISPVPGSVDDAVDILMKIYPINNGILTHREGQRVVAEINLQTEKERTRAIDKGIEFTPTITICATPALEKNAKIKKLRLTNLPLLSQEDLERGLRETFRPYGDILDVGINRDPRTKAYMGNGFAVLDIQPHHNQQLLPLNHHIPWCGDKDDLIYAHFDQMPLHCSRCHEPGHIVEDCPRFRRNQKGCFKCGGKNHYAANC
ncbi:hypothetical protein BDB00DRAFT_732393, partial [Zychaea mexicana]|uniref:uncharacterized protein n=1 Tax=Zychaea mexicana TaxID=64656 RepID=UPI0022FEE371